MGQQTEPHRWEERKGRQRAVGIDRRTEGEGRHAQPHFTLTLSLFIFKSHSTDQVATMKPAFVSIDSLTGSSSTVGALILVYLP